MDDIVYRSVSQPERLKRHDLESEDLVWLGRNAHAVVATDLDSNDWPTQLDIFYDIQGDATIVMPRGQHNGIVPYKLSGMIESRDVRINFRSEFVEPVAESEDAPIEHDVETPIVNAISQVSGSTYDPITDSIDADDEDEGK